MTDPYKHYVSGDEFQPSARQLNTWIDTAAASQGRALDPRQLAGDTDAGIVLVRNDTGADLKADKPILRLGAPLLLPADRLSVIFERPVFSGNTPGDEIDSRELRWAVCTGPLKDGAIGKAIVSGLTWVKVNVTNEDHTHVINADSSEELDSALWGKGQILWKEAGTGSLWCLIEMSRLDEIFLPAIADANIAGGATGTVSIYSWGWISDTNMDLTGVLNLSSEQADLGAQLLVARITHELGFIPMECSAA